MKIGEKFGRLTVVSERYKPDPSKYPYFVKCECQCGSGVAEYRCVSLTKNTNPTQSCGCLQKEKASALRTEVTGLEFSRLTVTEDLGSSNGRRLVLTDCSCGTKNFKVRFDKIQNLTTKSCGCLYNETRSTSNLQHGMSKTSTYYSWQNMKERCRNPNASGYENYGGRGITYDPRWEKFEAFFADMGERLGLLELDRIDVNGNYCKENCKWSDATEQSFNRRKQQGTSSEYTGVSSSVERSKWEAKLWKHNEIVFRGRFDTELEAALAYDEACMEHYGVRKNFPDMLTE